jgi:uncharacterized protein (DUF1499 family)
MSITTKVLIGIAGFVLVVLVVAQLGIFNGRRPDGLGARNGKLKACPGSPNCVSTQAQDDEHRIEPIAYSGERATVKAQLLNVIRAMGGTKIVVEQPDYVYVEFRTPGLQFVDDVEFYFDDEAQVVHFRSASRLGYSDLGLNRRRMEEIRRRFGGTD